jgi:hypothetical protein
MQKNKCEKSWLNMDPELQDFEAEKGFWSKVGQSFLMWLVAFALVIMTVMIVGCGDGRVSARNPLGSGPTPCDMPVTDQEVAQCSAWSQQQQGL